MRKYLGEYNMSTACACQEGQTLEALIQKLLPFRCGGLQEGRNQLDVLEKGCRSLL